MRVAYICSDPGVPVFGCKGCSIHVQEVIRALIKQGAKVDLFATRLGGNPPPDLNAVSIHKLPDLPKADPAVREEQAILANANLHAELRQNGLYDLIYERYSLWSFAGVEFAHAHGIPVVLEVNAPLIEEQEKHRQLVNRVVAEGVAKRVFGLATVLIAVSKPVADYLKGHPNTKGRVHVVPNGVNPDRFGKNVKPSSQASPGVFTVGFVGTLKPWHGILILLKAFSMLYQKNSHTRLLIVGDGTEWARVMANISAYGLLDAVHSTGIVLPDEVPGLLASMDVAVAPYPMQQNFYFSPMKVYEYMAAGLPVVASRIGQLEELIEDGVSGLLCPPGDPIALAEALDRLREKPELRARMGRAAKTKVIESYTWDLVVNQILTLAGSEFVSQPRLMEVGS